MSTGRHARPRPTGGGAPLALAVLVGGLALLVAVAATSGDALRLAVVALAAVAVGQLVMLARVERSSSRGIARLEARTRVLEMRGRTETDALHARVMASVAREAELHRAVVALAEEITRMRVSLDVLATRPVTATLLSRSYEMPLVRETAEAPDVEVRPPAPAVRRIVLADEPESSPAPPLRFARPA